MDFRTCIDSLIKNDKIKIMSDQFNPYLEISKQIIHYEPTPVLFKNINNMQVGANIFCTRDAIANFLEISISNFLLNLSKKLERLLQN